jgi:hypothetical protein
MISTVCGNDAQFKANTLKPSGSITNDPDNWMDYTAVTNSKLNLPGSGVWKVYLDVAYSSMAFEMLEGEEKTAVDIVTNESVVVVKGQEREDLIDSKNNEGVITVREEADDPAGVDVGGDGHNGETWDNQFFIKANHKLEKGTVTKLVFKYKASVAEAKTTTQCHGENPGDYKHWAAIGDVTFTTEWQDFEKDFTVPAEADGMWNIAFNMAEIKEACDYELKDFEWYLKGDENTEGKTWENLINKEGTSNFFVKEGAGTTPHEFVDPTGINEVAAKKNITTATYNLAGQRVSDSFKGIVIKDGKKFVK